MTQMKRLRRNLSWFALTALLTGGFSAWAAGCGSDDSSQFPGGNDGGGGDGQTFGDGGGGLGNNDGGGNGGDGSAQAIVITPANPTVNVTITNGVVTATPVDFVAKTLSGSPVAASWSLDRGELGTLVTGTGVFSAGGTVAGTGIVSAAYGASIATTKVTVTIDSVQIGNDYGDGGVPDGGAGGVGGVGGEGLGGAVDGGVENSLATTGTAPTSKAQLGFLYPYDKTVWPRGQLAPLLQWESNLTGISAVYIHLSEAGYDFKGYYSVSGPSQYHQPIDQAAWAQATNSNTGDNLHVELKVLSSTGVIGPITRDWIVAPGILQGTVYYNSYRTQLAVPVSGETRAAAVLSIKPGATGPTLAIPGARTQCVVCHVVSDDGSTMFAQYGVEPGNDYSRGDSYDLADGGAHIQTYTGTASDGTTNNRKFLWSAPWKDGTFAMQSNADGDGNETQEAFVGPENIYRRDNGAAAPSTGLGGVNLAVTPSFSRDGKSVAFDGWTMNGDAGLPSGNGHTLDVMDFACGSGGSTDGGPSCGSMAFSALRRVYTNTDTTNGYVGWPAWTPDSEALVFHNVVTKPTGGAPLATWNNAQAQLWYTNIPPSSGTYPDGGTAPAAAPIRMNALNGLDSTGASYLPLPADATNPNETANSNHSLDTLYNYEPTINPIASGGYYWVVFTSRRMYGNIATLDAFDTGNGSDPVAKKLWVAAIDINPTPGTDPSHPAFYLPGQEINAGNMRGFWVVDPCRSNGSSCDTGDECCNGFCRAPDDGGGLVCGDKLLGCAQEFEKCTTSADCCGSGSLTCINGTCSVPGPR
jgi:hypothetical protein